MVFSTAVVMAMLQQESLNECRPSPIGVFLTRIGIRKDARKPMTITTATSQNYECATATTTTETSPTTTATATTNHSQQQSVSC